MHVVRVVHEVKAAVLDAVHVLNILLVLPHQPVGGTVVGIFGIGNGGLLRQHEVDVPLGNQLVLGRDGNAHGVHIQVGSLGRIVELQVLILLVHGHEVPGVVGGDGCRAVLHLVVYLIHDVALHDMLLLPELLQRLPPVCLAVRVDIQPKQVLRGAESIARVVELQDIAGVALVPEQIPAAEVGVIRVNHGGVVNNAHHAVHIRHGVRAALVVVVVLGILAVEVPVQVDKVRDVRVIQLLHQSLRNQPLNHIVRRHHHIVGHRPGGQLGVHILVAGKGGVIDAHTLAVGFVVPFLKGGVGVQRILRTVGDILAPVVNVERRDLARDLLAGGQERQGTSAQAEQCRAQRDDAPPGGCFVSVPLFHARTPPSRRLARAVRKEPAKLTASSTARIITTMRAHSAYILNLTLCAVWL